MVTEAESIVDGSFVHMNLPAGHVWPVFFPYKLASHVAKLAADSPSESISIPAEKIPFLKTVVELWTSKTQT